MSQQHPLPKHAPLPIVLTERRNADFETYSGLVIIFQLSIHHVLFPGRAGEVFGERLL